MSPHRIPRIDGPRIAGTSRDANVIKQRTPLESATVMTWASILARAASLFVVLPLILSRFETSEIAYWYLLMSLIGLQQVADFGFSPTYARAFAYAIGGGQDRVAEVLTASEPNAEELRLGAVWGAMHDTFVRVSLVATVVFALVGALSIAKPVDALTTPAVGWVGFAVVVGVFAVTVRLGGYSAYLQGIDEIAKLRRWETLAALGASLSAAGTVALGGGLLSLVLMNQCWMLLSAIRIRSLALNARDGVARRIAGAIFSSGPGTSVSAAAWRSGVGIAMSRGVQVISGAIVAQVVPPGPLAAYLLAQRLLQVIVDAANAPFYTKLPRLATSFAQGDIASIREVARRGMRLSLWVLVLACGAVGITAEWLLDAIGSNAPWVGGTVWAVMLLGAFVERFGAMHLQLYSTTNHIVWHTLNGLTGVLLLAIGAALLPAYGLLAFPVATLLAYPLFYSWYSARLASRAFDFQLLAFHRWVALPAGIVALVLALVTAALF